MNTRYKQIKESAKGFTIIEVVLVLAIAGLIFLMVFIALPALQRGQRDAQRREDLSRINTQLQNFSSASRGSIPSSNNLGTFVKQYLGGSLNGCASTDYRDPSRTSGDTPSGGTGCDNYLLKVGDSSTTVGDAQIVYQPGSKCADDGTGGTVGGSSRNYSLRVSLENQTAPYCIDNR